MIRKVTLASLFALLACGGPGSKTPERAASEPPASIAETFRLPPIAHRAKSRSDAPPPSLARAPLARLARPVRASAPWPSI